MSALPEFPAATLACLIEAGAQAHAEFRARDPQRFSLVVPCDHAGAYEALRALRPRASTFLELGSATGVVTILADLLGYEACGIELDPWLVRRATELAEAFESRATFAEGTFVPLEYQDEIEHLSGEFHTPTAGACAYDELGLELSDFDLVFSYPWPGDEDWLCELVRRHARSDAMLLTYAETEGFRVMEPAAH